MYSSLRDSNNRLPDKVDLVNPIIPHGDHILATVNFIMLGLLSAYPWNAVPDIINTVMYELYDIEQIFTAPIIINEIIIFGLIIYYAHYGGVRPQMLKWTCFIFSAIIFIIPFVIHFFSKKSFMIKLLVFWVGLRFALYMGIIFTVSASISSTLPVNYNGLISLGSGISGLISFILFLLADRVIWPRTENNEESDFNLLKTTWFLFGIATFVCMLGGVIFTSLTYRGWFQDRIKTYWSSIEDIVILTSKQQDYETSSTYELDDDFEVLSVYEMQEKETHPESFLELAQKAPDEFDITAELPIELQQSRSPFLLFKECWRPMVAGSLTLWVTLFLFPLIGPYHWPNSIYIDIHISLFLTFDLIGRYIATMIKPFRVSTSILLYIGFLRIFFIPLVTLPIFLEHAIFNSLAYQVIIISLLSISNGFNMTSSMICTPELVRRIKERGKVGTYNILLFHICVIMGYYCSCLYVMGIDYVLST